MMSRSTLGVDYPKPMLQPVSLTTTEAQEDEAREAQRRRAEQNLQAKRQRLQQGFRKQRLGDN